MYNFTQLNKPFNFIALGHKQKATKASIWPSIFPSTFSPSFLLGFLPHLLSFLNPLPPSYINMRNQIHRHKQAITQKTIANLTETSDAVPSSPDSKNIHKSICFIQITDFGEANPKDNSKHFRNTFFGKLGRRIAPKRDFVDSALDKQRTYTETGPQRKTERPGVKEHATQNEYSERSSFIIQQLNNYHKMSGVKEDARECMTEHRKGTKCRVKQTELVKDIEKLRECENSYLQHLKRNSHEQNYNEQLLPQGPRLLHRHSDGESRSQDWGMSKEDIILELKEKLKNKQSRKHIYHTLKSKNELWNKIRFKTHQNFHPRERTEPQVLKTESEVMRLHCHLKNTAKSVYSINSKTGSNKAKDNLHNLRIQSKPCTISYNTYPIPHLYSPLKQFLSPQCSPTASPQANASRNRPKRGLYDEIITGIKATRQGKDGRERQDCNAGNEFRLLTPWKNIDEQQM